MIADVLTGLMKLAIAGLFMWGLYGHAEQSVELDGEVVEKERRLQELRLVRQDLVERIRLAEGLVAQAETLLALRPEGEPAGDDEAAAMRAVDRFAVGLAAGFHCRARLSFQAILADAGDGPGNDRAGGCEPNPGSTLVEGGRTWPAAWTEELDGMRRGVERKLSDLDRELEQADGRVGRLQLIGNVYIMSGAFLAILMLVLQTAISVGGLFGSGGTGRR
ncbi:MAG: hypothetical protein F4X35_04940 [Alphaproteobacteria bacterium]|nr:hypothetical protein [Alphaproteobacteria bacterium]